MMQEMKWAMRRKGARGLTRAVVGIVLLALLVGLWAYLWVPPSIF
jgi:hypothetical protein